MEKYGTIPKRFTKDWWKYFWEYYKIHTISAGITVVIISTTTYQCATQTKYDLNMSYIGEYIISDEMQASITEQLKGAVDEITDNKQIDISLFSYSMNLENEDRANAEYNYAMQVKLTAELQSGDTDIYILSASNGEALNTYSDCFMDVSAFSSQSYSDDMLLKDASGRPFAVSIRDNPIFQAAGIDSSDMYITVRMLYDVNKNKDKSVLMHNNSIRATKFLLGE